MYGGPTCTSGTPARCTRQRARRVCASGRRAAVDQVVTELGGTVEAMYFAFGEDDIVLILDFPDPASMAASSLIVKASGALRSRATPLLTLDEIDEAARRKVAFRAPGT
ncbi:GYD domain-containing protein [Streptomyces meridianus]|uniref:GYD domain-containing protein n=1 Tax=Streptomyces meridianus TaxID=2938945 RepID=A0ABT0XAU9_9ACTN|nr:GYD domain-containing protein [Streptomyces meridianus]MCM2579048.1 GYD domain-containing protein [Streptomyces meridianus]